MPKGAQPVSTAQQHAHLPAQAAVWLLASLASLHRRPFDADLLLKRFAPPLDLPALIEALEALGLKAGLSLWPGANEWQSVRLPAVAFVDVPEAAEMQTPAPGEPPAQHDSAALMPLLVVAHDGQTLSVVKPGEQAPQPLPPDEAARLAPCLLLVAEADPVLAEENGETGPAVQSRKPFGFSWFVPELLRHKRLWRDVLLASLSIQLVALATPLFTQVIIDKVIAHHSESTLVVLGVAMVAFMLFTSVMSWLRQYLVLHTGSRIDAVLGEKVMRHLLRLPLPYFEQRPTGTLVARLHGVETLREFVSGAAVTLVLDLPFLFIFLAVMFFYS